MRLILKPKFFDRSALAVGRDLLGKFIVRSLGSLEIAALITEVEVYDGFEDRASHAFCGKTERNKVMWNDAGSLYVYFVYGMYWMLNVVVGKKNYPAAVLIRGAGEWQGPGKLTRALKIGKQQNDTLALPTSGLWFEDRGVKPRRGEVKRLPRVGVRYAGDVWSNKPYRFRFERKEKLLSASRISNTFRKRAGMKAECR